MIYYIVEILKIKENISRFLDKSAMDLRRFVLLLLCTKFFLPNSAVSKIVKNRPKFYNENDYIL